jgi:UMF1 family MFS transporter
MASIAGLVMGIQALSRSTYSKLLPETHDTASFSFMMLLKIGIVWNVSLRNYRSDYWQPRLAIVFLGVFL